MKALKITLLFSLLVQLTFAQQDKDRLIILADMGNEPDEEQQMVHMIMYSNEFDIEALIAVSGKYLHSAHRIPERRQLYPDLFHKIIDAYQRDLPNIRKHAGGWPEPEYLHSIVATGQPDYGIDGAKTGNSTPGSELIINALTKDDPRPVYIVVNAGSNTLAQAIMDYEAQHTKSELENFIGKMRIFENGAQDNAGAWICANYPNIHWVRSNYQTYSYGGPTLGYREAGEVDKYKIGPYTWEPFEYSFLGQHHWALQHLKAYHGHLGKAYPLRQMDSGRILFLDGGGTIPWMGLVHRGLSDISQAHWGGWSGRFSREKVEDIWSRHQDIQEDEKAYGKFKLYSEVADHWIDPETDVAYHNEYAPVWRWRRAMYNDFKCRMDWCTVEFNEANHAPHAAVNGDKEEKIHYVDALSGETVKFDASASSDPDNDGLKYQWWIYEEADTYDGDIGMQGADSFLVSMEMPEDAKGKDIHLILEVKDDNSIASMYDYRRIILSVK